MALGNVMRGNGTYAVGWSTVAAGLMILASDAGALAAASDVSCTAMLKPLLTSEGFLMMLGGLGLNGVRRAMKSADTRNKEALKELLVELENGRKEP